jgi:hypothetical protein
MWEYIFSDTDLRETSEAKSSIEMETDLIR